jgi:hypothetical protein
MAWFQCEEPRLVVFAERFQRLAQLFQGDRGNLDARFHAARQAAHACQLHEGIGGLGDVDGGNAEVE